MKSLLCIALLGMGMFAQAQTKLDKNAEQAFVEKLSRVGQVTKSSSGQADSCEPPTPSSCSFEGYCGKLAEGAQDAYLYKDSEGRQIPNHNYVKLSKQVQLCNGKVSAPMPEDPFLNPDLFSTKANQEKLAAATARTKQLFDKVRNEVVAVLKKKRTEQNGAQIDNMIKRVQSVQFKSVDLVNIKPHTSIAAKLADEGCISPNAAYNLEDHSITICPQTMNMPEGALVGTLAHEFGHSFDSCSSALAYSSQGAVFPLWMNMLVKENKSKQTVDGISAKENPFKNVITCLQSEKSIGVKVPTKSELHAAVDKKRKFLESEMQEAFREDQEQSDGEESFSRGSSRDASVAALDDEDSNINKYYDDYCGCAALSGSILLNEAFADWVSGETIASMTSELPADKAKEFAFASSGIFYSQGCAEVADKVEKYAQALAPKCKSLENYIKDQHSHVEALPHPDTAKRVNRIYMAKPEIRKALACQGGDVGTPCE
ncbi:hypothetical protein [Bdellovibrio sp. HCB209]|uniref:hypothetical protein n=1 Tax=Bdellovibrio sp. HCB209 TaxID=3394354 RepID=UPI0039B5A420